MKFLKYSLIGALVLSGALCSCSDDDDYAPGAAATGNEVYFSTDEPSSIDIPDQATSISVNVNRVKTSDALTVNVTGAVLDSEGNPADAFTLSPSVSFAQGQAVAPYTIAVDFSKVVPDEEYYLNLKLDSETTPYGAPVAEFALVYAPWTEWAPVTDEIGVYTITQYTGLTVDVPVLKRTSAIDPNRVEYAVCDLYYDDPDEKAGPLINYVFAMDLSKTIEVDGVKCPLVSMTPCPFTFYENGDGSQNYFQLYDVRSWLINVVGRSESTVDSYMASKNWGQSYYNPETGTFAVDMALAGTKVPAGSAYGIGYEYLQLPGFKSYTIKMDYTGNYVDAAGTEYAIVSAVKSEDVQSFVYDLFPGELSEDEIKSAVEEIKANEELLTVNQAPANLAFALTEPGAYTVVAVGSADGEYVCEAAYTFNFESVKVNDPWTTLGYCEYTDGIVNSAFNIPTLTFDVEIQESDEIPGYYRLVDPYKEMSTMFKGAEYLKGKHYIYIDAQNPDQVSIEESYFGLDLGYGEMGVISLSAYALNKGISAEVIAAKGWFGSLKDGVITFPAGTLIGMDNDGEFDANLDPNNPTRGDKDKYDPFYGTGTFKVDMSGITAAKAKKAKVKGNFNLGSVRKDANFKNRKYVGNFVSSKNKQTIIDAKTYNEYQLSHPRQLN